MSSKMKGILKGLRYISHIFEDEKEEEMQIGLPTDVKHVAHIGSDGPSTNEPPSWMKEFKSGSVFQSAPLGPPEDLREDSEIKWVSEDSGRGRRETNSGSKELPSSRRYSSVDNTNDSPRKKDSSTKSKQSRRNPQTKDPPDNKSSRSSSSTRSSSNRNTKESTSSAPHNLPDIPKKSRRKKSKESVTDPDGSSRSLQSRCL